MASQNQIIDLNGGRRVFKTRCDCKCQSEFLSGIFNYRQPNSQFSKLTVSFIKFFAVRNNKPKLETSEATNAKKMGKPQHKKGTRQEMMEIHIMNVSSSSVSSSR